MLTIKYISSLVLDVILNSQKLGRWYWIKRLLRYRPDWYYNLSIYRHDLFNCKELRIQNVLFWRGNIYFKQHSRLWERVYINLNVRY